MSTIVSYYNSSFCDFCEVASIIPAKNIMSLGVFCRWISVSVSGHGTKHELSDTKPPGFPKLKRIGQKSWSPGLTTSRVSLRQPESVDAFGDPVQSS